MSDSVPEPVEARPWVPDDGPPPHVWTWPRTDPPALLVRSRGRWHWATVTARQDYADGRVVYQVVVDLDGFTSVITRLYAWPQPGLRVGYRSTSQPSDRLLFSTSMPHAPPR
ncbi:hypothetical protein ACFYWY_35665 [Streptomyces sp. NPDC002870]|uniref:hypothetical protein n=1 Tax=Streptomyces sp. NPDC002870 TaxID=3364666 RepID=UPI0036CA30E9